jgi:hypothetical protein
MKITFKSNVDCDYYDHRFDETYPKYFRRWDELVAEAVDPDGSTLRISLSNGDIITNVPSASIEVKG